MESNPFQSAIDLCNFSRRISGKNGYIIDIEEGTVKGPFGNYIFTHISKDGYRRSNIFGRSWYLHRFIYSYAFGEIPVGKTVDHIDQNPNNNRISNLRLVSSSENNLNRKKFNRRTKQECQDDYIKSLNK